MLRAIGRFFKSIFVTTPFELLMMTVVVLVCMQAMVAPFFYYPPNKKPRRKPQSLSLATDREDGGGAQ